MKYAPKEMDLSFVLLEIKGQLPFFTEEIIKDVSNSIKYEMNHLCAGGSWINWADPSWLFITQYWMLHSPPILLMMIEG